MLVSEEELNDVVRLAGGTSFVVTGGKAFVVAAFVGTGEITFVDTGETSFVGKDGGTTFVVKQLMPPIITSQQTDRKAICAVLSNPCSVGNYNV